MKTKLLFEEVTLKNGIKIKNRFFKSSMSEALGDKYLQPKEEICNLYKLWALGGTGLVITGNVMIDENYLAEPGNIVFNEKSNMDILKKWAEAGGTNNTKIMVQINHPGKQAPKTVSKKPVAPSKIPLPGRFSSMFNEPRELTNREVKELVEKFAVAAKVAKKAGFSGVQIHAAHGYLISQFLSAVDNIRTDEYGGSLENRMRFLKEIYLAIREKVGNEFPIGIKINSTDFREGGFSEEESIYVVKKLDEIGIDFIEVSGGNYENSKMLDNTDKNNERIFFADYSKKIKKMISAPVIVTGGIRSVESMINVIEEDIADFVGIARPLAMEPNIPNQIENGIYETVETRRLTTGLKAVDSKVGGLLGLVYYQMLMQKYAKGKKIKLTTNAWPALLHSIYHQGMISVLPQRARKE